MAERAPKPNVARRRCNVATQSLSRENTRVANADTWPISASGNRRLDERRREIREAIEGKSPQRRRFASSGARIRADAENAVVRVSIAGLDQEGAIDLIKMADAEAMKLLNIRTSLRRFRPPITIRFLDAKGRVAMTLARSGCTLEEPGDTIADFALEKPAEAAPSVCSWTVAEDSRGRKASVRMEITK